MLGGWGPNHLRFLVAVSIWISKAVGNSWLPNILSRSPFSNISTSSHNERDKGVRITEGEVSQRSLENVGIWCKQVGYFEWRVSAEKCPDLVSKHIGFHSHPLSICRWGSGFWNLWSFVLTSERSSLEWNKIAKSDTIWRLIPKRLHTKCSMTK